MPHRNNVKGKQRSDIETEREGDGGKGRQRGREREKRGLIDIT